MERLVHAYAYAAEQHRSQRRKDDPDTPYINHPASVAHRLVTCGVADEVALVAAVLHDVVEDTSATLADVEKRFGPDVAAVVAEVTDDRTLGKAERKRRQVETAGGKSEAARLVKLADKLDNLESMRWGPPRGWDPKRVRGYVIWALAVVRELSGTNDALKDQLEAAFKRFGVSLNDVPAKHAAELDAYYASME